MTQVYPFYSNDHPFSQWYRCRFINEHYWKFYSAEQYMMYHKAKLFRDEKTADLIMKTKSPRTAKALGRKVKPFIAEIWEKKRCSIVVRGNYLKFSQNPDLRKALLATKDKILVEASPQDKIWGVGMRSTNSRIHDPKLWKGLNLLGKCLMKVRKLIVDIPVEPSRVLEKSCDV